MALDASQFAGKVTIADGAWGTELDKLGCPPGFCREEWNVTRPDLVGKVAQSYVEAGARIILTNTFGANRFVLSKHGRADKVAEYNRAGAAISKQVIDGKGHVFASIGPSGKLVMIGEVSEEELFEAFREQAAALAEGGADALVVETMTDLTEAVAGVRAAKTTGLPVVASLTYDSGPEKTNTMMGVTPEKAAEALTGAGADIIGCNCGIGIENYIKVAAKLRAVTDKPVWVKANAGLPEIEDGKIVYRMTPQEFALKARKLVEAGANIIGGCCGTSPEFIRALSETLVSAS
ncbi:MAG: methionine synthase [Phycisphaerae bacterium]|jgi:5-methyltetrahydrofolate--homocysteine methyltransferase|nr:methionine synthase [Phycisphaerae bacterium]HXK85392.1 homocysteine S-methyltransferase family protein [Phycisphaerae bacterium]